MAGYIGNKSSVVSSGAERKFKFTITETTTTLSNIVYTPTLVHVFHNGVRLVDGTDYTATNGTSITLTNAAENGDEVVVISYASFQTSDTVSASAGGTFGGNITINADLTVSGNTDINGGTIDGTVIGGSTPAAISGTTGTFSSDMTGTDLTLSGGVYLGGTGAANYLDDYEEGTWTPDLRIGSSSTGITYTGRSGNYIKTGNMVFVVGVILLSSKGSLSGTVDIYGLPFTVADITSATSLDGGGGMCSFSGGTSGIYTSIGVNGIGGQTYAGLYSASSSGGSMSANLLNGNITNSFSIRFSLTYYAA